MNKLSTKHSFSTPHLLSTAKPSTAMSSSEMFSNEMFSTAVLSTAMLSTAVFSNEKLSNVTHAACDANRPWTFINATYGHQRPSGAPPS